jgi:glycosyltransferase involved in cell wall biosynthesis
MKRNETRARVDQIVVFVADNWEHVCPVIRVTAPAEAAGLAVVRGNELGDEGVRLFPERIAQADLVIIQRDFPAYEDAYEKVVSEARAHGKTVVYELDDLLLRMPDVHPDLTRYERTRFAILSAILEADAVTAPSFLLCEYLKRFNRNTWLHPNYLVDSCWGLRDLSGTAKTGAGPVVVGYMGGHSHAPDIEMIAPVLERLLAKYGEEVRLRFWGVAPPSTLTGRPNVEAIYPGFVDYRKFAKYFGQQECDIFIAPLLDTPFNQCKSPLKFLEYSSLGVPGVYSRIAPYEEVVEHGQNGFLASTQGDWERHLCQLIEDQALRLRMGERAQSTVRENWLLSDRSRTWPELMRRIKALQSPPRDGRSVYLALKEAQGWFIDLETKSAEVDALAQVLRGRMEEQARSAQDLAARLRAFRARLNRQEKEQETLRQELAESRRSVELMQARIMLREREAQDLGARISSITSGEGWQFVQALRSLRLSLVPQGGIRERVFNAGERGIRLWRAQGGRAFVQVMIRKVAGLIGFRARDRKPEAMPGRTELSSIRMSAEPGEICPLPAIAVVAIEQEGDVTSAEEVLRWCGEQTCGDIELVIWSKEKGLAWRQGTPQDAWSAGDLRSLCIGLHSRYLCVASDDLLRQPSTYLEVNLIALETESLAFTLNTLGVWRLALENLSLGLLPGSATSPLLRMVVRKDCVRGGFSLEIPGAMGSGDPVVGKLIVHSSNAADDASSFVFETQIRPEDIVQVGRHLLTASEVGRLQQVIHHVTHPVDTVIRPTLRSISEPTVLVVLPFLAIGGAERLLLRVMRRLRDRIRFVVVTVDKLDAALGTTGDEFLQITPYVYNLYDFLESHLFFSFFSYLIGRFEPGSLYIANGATWIYDAISSLRAAFPAIRMIDQVYHHQLGWIGRYDASVVASLDAHIGGNPAICSAYLERGARTGQVFLVEHGLEADEFDPADYSMERRASIKTGLGIPGEVKVVTFVARLHPQKRPLDFVELARRFRSEASLAFLMIGGGPMAGVVGDQVNRAGLANLWRHSYYQPVSDIYAISDAIVIPSEYEATPLVLLESQAMGKPVVATDVGNNREVLEYTQGGKVVSSVGDVSQLEAALRDVLAMSFDPIRMRQAVIERFGMARIAEDYYRILIGEASA